MAMHPSSIDISHMPDLIRLAEEVAAINQPRELKRASKGKTSVQEALALAGAWADLPSDQMEQELDRIRHQSKPTPPLDLDL